MAYFTIRYFLLMLYSCSQTCSIFTYAVPYKPAYFTAGEWQEAYSEVFGNDSGRELNEAQVMERVTFMQEEAIEENKSITREQKDIVAYWYSVLMDTDTNHCNTNHLTDVLEHLELLRNPSSSNLATLFWLVHGNLIYFCNELHVDIKEQMRKLFSFETYAKLMRISFRFELWIEGLATKKKLAKELFKTLDVDKTVSRSKIVKAWNEGPCKQVRTVMESAPQFESFHEFVKLHAYAGLASVKQCPSNTYLWVRIVYACDELTAMIPDLAKENSLTTVANRRIKSCYKGMKSGMIDAFDRMVSHC